MEQREEYIRLLNGCIDVIERNKGTVIGGRHNWIVDGDDLAKKLISHLLSTADLMEGTKPTLNNPAINVKFFDFHSINVLSRAALETYLTLNYILFDNKSKNERKLRYRIWEISGLSNRQRVKLQAHGVQGLQKNELKQLRSLRRQVRKSKYYQSNVNPDALKKINNRSFKNIDWKPVGGWKGLAVIAKYKPDFFEDIYNHLSTSAHSDRSSATQVQNNPTKTTQIKMTGIAINSCLIVMALFLKNYSKQFPKVNNVIDDNPELKNLVTIWSGLHDKGYITK